MTDTKKPEIKYPYIDPQCYSMGQEGRCRHWVVLFADMTPFLMSGRILTKLPDWKALAQNCDASLIQHLESDTNTTKLPWNGLDKQQRKVIMTAKPRFKQKVAKKYLKNRVCCLSDIISTKKFIESIEVKSIANETWDQIYSMDRRHNINRVFDQKTPDQAELLKDLQQGFTICFTGGFSYAGCMDHYFSSKGLPEGKILRTRIGYPS